MFWARLENQVWAKLGPEPPTRGPEPPTRPAGSGTFSGPHSGTFFCKLFAAFAGIPKKNVDPTDPTLCYAFPGNSKNHVDQKNRLGIPGEGNKFRNGPQKKVPKPAGLVGDSGALVGGSAPSLAQT